MKTFLPRLWILVLAVLGLQVTAGPAPLPEDAKTAFRHGIEALDRKDWSLVLEHMRIAAAAAPPSGGRVRVYGMRLEPYTPFYFQGLAWARLGECEQARATWARSAAFGALSRRQQRGVDRELEDCRALPIDWQQAAALGPQGPVMQVEAPSLDLPEPGPSPRRRSDDAPPPPAGPTAPAREPTPKRPDPDQEPVQDPEPVQEPAPENTVPKKPVQEEEVVIPAPLRQAAQAFLVGRYDRVLDFLEGFDAGEPSADAAAHLLRSASRFALYRKGQRLDPSLLDAARQDARACRRAVPELRPPVSFFSPAFVRFFEESLP